MPEGPGAGSSPRPRTAAVRLSSGQGERTGRGRGRAAAPSLPSGDPLDDRPGRTQALPCGTGQDGPPVSWPRQAGGPPARSTGWGGQVLAGERFQTPHTGVRLTPRSAQPEPRDSVGCEAPAWALSDPRDMHQAPVHTGIGPSRACSHRWADTPQGDGGLRPLCPMQPSGPWGLSPELRAAPRLGSPPLCPGPELSPRRHPWPL